MDKLAALNEILQLDPANAFARYGLAMEHIARDNPEAALAEFATCTGNHHALAEMESLRDELTSR
jgi:cytochrome c-type biogenesis protein CcmH/NrfG